MNDIILQDHQLPSTVEDLSRFILVGREKLIAVRAEIRAINAVGLATEVREQKLKEAQAIAEAVLDAEVRIGQLMAEVPKATKGNQYTGKMVADTGVDNQHQTKKEVIEDAGLNVKQVERFEELAEYPELVEEAKAEARANDTIVTRSSVLEKAKNKKRAEKEAKREKQRQENAEKIEQLATPLEAQGLFQTIVIDPPWDWGDEGDVNQFGRARPDYHTMPIEEIEQLPVGKIADDNCHLYLWVTNRSLPKAFKLIESWGFRYITCLTWVKPSIGMGNYFRGSTEQVLFAVKGSQPLKRKDVGTWFKADRGKEHSAKPDEFYDLVESCSYAPYIDIFGRKDRECWSVWGENG